MLDFIFNVISRGVPRFVSCSTFLPALLGDRLASNSFGGSSGYLRRAFVPSSRDRRKGKKSRTYHLQLSQSATAVRLFYGGCYLSFPGYRYSLSPSKCTIGDHDQSSSRPWQNYLQSHQRVHRPGAGNLVPTIIPQEYQMHRDTSTAKPTTQIPAIQL